MYRLSSTTGLKAPPTIDETSKPGNRWDRAKQTMTPKLYHHRDQKGWDYSENDVTVGHGRSVYDRTIPLSVGRGQATEINHFLTVLIVRLTIGRKGGRQLRPALYRIGRRASCHTDIKGFVMWEVRNPSPTPPTRTHMVQTSKLVQEIVTRELQ